MLQTKCSRDLPFDYSFSCNPFLVYLLPFIYHLFGTSDRARTCNLRFRRPLHFLLCYRGIWCASWDSNPEKTRGLNPPHLPFCHKRIIGTPGGTRTLKRPGSLVQRICQLCYQGIFGIPARTRTGKEDVSETPVSAIPTTRIYPDFAARVSVPPNIGVIAFQHLM